MLTGTSCSLSLTISPTRCKDLIRLVYKMISTYLLPVGKDSVFSSLHFNALKSVSTGAAE
jgi:hypothetical protein